MNSQTSHAAGSPAFGAEPPRPPGPSTRWFGFPLFREMARDYIGFWAAQQRRHGDVVYARLGPLHDYSFFHPDHVRQILVAAHDNLIRWERGTEVFSTIHGHSVLIAEGAQWQRQRALLQPGFALRQVETFVPRMAEATELAMRGWAGLDNFCFEAAMTELTIAVILRALFSRAERAQCVATAGALHALGQIAMREMFWPMSAPLWAPWKSPKRRAIRTLDALIRRELAHRRANPAPREDLLQFMLDLRDESGHPLGDEALRDECMTTFLAGHETTAAALTWWGWCMAANPLAQRRATEEIDTVLNGRVPTAADLANLPWLKLCVRETLRLYPPAPALFTRRTTAPLVIDGWQVPAGSTLRLTPAVMQRDARWYEEPDAFRPERFDPASGHAEIPRGAWLPFGAGPRMCLGSHFALTEISLIAAQVLQRFHIEALPGAAPRPVLNVTLRPAEPLVLRLVRR